MSILWISILLYCIVAFTKACDEPRGWVSKSMEERANESSSTVIVGKVNATFDGSGGGQCASDTECGYWANILVECVIKDNTNITIGSIVKVVGFGVNSDCIETQIQKNSMYLLLITVTGNMYTVEEVNRQPGTERVTEQQVDTYVNQFSGSFCRQETTTAPTTTIPTTQQARTSTSAKILSTMNQVTTKLKNEQSNQERGAKLEEMPTTNAVNASSKILIPLLALAVMILTLLVVI